MYFLLMCVLSRFSHVRLFATPWTVAHKVPLPMGFSRQEYWSGLPCLPPRDLPNPGIKPRSPSLQADSLPSEPSGKPKKTSPADLPDPGIKPGSPALQADSLPTELTIESDNPRERVCASCGTTVPRVEMRKLRP